MLTEIAIAIILSICTTALLFSISNVLTKKWKISHPKNTLLISLIVLCTAFSVIPFAAIAFSTMGSTSQPDIENSVMNGVPILPSTIVTQNQNITYSSSIKPIAPYSLDQNQQITRYLQKITWSEMIIYDEYDSSTSDIDPSITQQVNTSQFFKKTLIAINNGEMNTPELINQVITNLLINQKDESQITTETSIEQDDEKTTPIGLMNSSQNLFFLSISLLFFISISYIISSIYIGKSHTLKRLHAKVCKDEEILGIIKKIAKEFNISPPKIYSFNGPPNAFVFGHPAVLAYSNQLRNFLSDKEFEAALRHELAHIRHHDTVLKPILQGLRIFFFYNPLVHLLSIRIVKNMEILADNQTFSSKKEKISLMEALIKISEYSHPISTRPVPSYQIPLISYHTEKLTLTERFTYLFESTSKKTVITLLLVGIIIFTNISMFFVAGAVFSSKNQYSLMGETEEFSIEESYYSQSIQYTKIERNAKTYLAMIVQKNLYNVIETKSSTQLVDDIMEQFIPDENFFTIPSVACESY